MPQSQCTNLELSQELKKLGYPQESLFVWAIPTHDQEWLEGGREYRLLYWEDFNQESATMVAAPTVAELDEVLSKYGEYGVVEYHNEIKVSLVGRCEVYSKQSENRADVRARLLIQLLKSLTS